MKKTIFALSLLAAAMAGAEQVVDISGVGNRKFTVSVDVSHPMFAKLQIAVAQEPEKAKKIVEILYAQALLMADLPLEDPGAYSDLVCELLG